MDQNVKPQTLVKTFIQANYMYISSWSIRCSSHNFVDLSLSTCTAERSFSGMKRLQTPLRRTMTDERSSSLAILHIHKHKNIIDIDGIITEFAARLKDGITVLPFFTVNSLYLTDNTRRWVK